MMEHYKVYLRAELGKLGNLGDAEQFLERLPHNCLEENGFSLLPQELVEQFALQDQVNAFVAELSDTAMVALTGLCDNCWRRNGVSHKLSPRQESYEIEAPINQLLLSRAEPELHDLFNRNGWRLVDIAQDHEILNSEPYRHHHPGEEVAFKTCLAEEVGGGYKIFDGIHRAIQLVRNGASHVPLCVVRGNNAASACTQ